MFWLIDKIVSYLKPQCSTLSTQCLKRGMRPAVTKIAFSLSKDLNGNSENWSIRDWDDEIPSAGFHFCLYHNLGLIKIASYIYEPKDIKKPNNFKLFVREDKQSSYVQVEMREQEKNIINNLASTLSKKKKHEEKMERYKEAMEMLNKVTQSL